MNKSLVRLLACLICLAFLFPTSIAQAGPSITLLSTTETRETNRLIEEHVFLPLIMNGLLCAKAPTLLEPANGASLDNLIPLFKWNDGDDPNATELQLQVARNADFTQTTTSLGTDGSVGIGENRFFTNFEPFVKYYWRTFLKCGDTQSPYSEVWSFTTGSGGIILPAPNLIAPADDALLTSLPADLQWLSVDGAVEYVVRWALTGNLGGYFSYNADTDFTINWGLNPSTTYDWWITARNDYAWGVESVKRQFTTPAAILSTSQEHFSTTINVGQGGEIIQSK